MIGIDQSKSILNLIIIFAYLVNVNSILYSVVYVLQPRSFLSAEREIPVMVAFCGHTIHSDCWDPYYASLLQRLYNNRFVEGGMAVNIEAGEYLCPLCKSVSNLLVPKISKSSESEKPSISAAFGDTLASFVFDRLPKIFDEVSVSGANSYFGFFNVFVYSIACQDMTFVPYYGVFNLLLSAFVALLYTVATEAIF